MWDLSHHRDNPSSSSRSPTKEDLRLLMPHPTRAGDLLYLHSMLHPPKSVMPDDIGIPPEARSQEMNDDIEALFVRH